MNKGAGMMGVAVRKDQKAKQGYVNRNIHVQGTFVNLFHTLASAAEETVTIMCLR